MSQAVAFRPSAYIPTSARTGNNSPSILRGRNAFIRGHEDNTYAECYGGSLDLGFDVTLIPVVGTLQTTSGSRAVVGTGTAFMGFFPGMRLFIQGVSILQILVIDTIEDDTHLHVVTESTNSESAQTAVLPYVLFEVGKRRGYALWGNVLEFDLGTLLGVGLGTFFLDGAGLPGSSLVLSKKAQVALLDGATGNYSTLLLLLGPGPGGIVATAGTAPAAKTFTDADVNTATDNINVVAHGYSTGQPVTLSNPGTQISVNGALLSENRIVFLDVIDVDNFKLADLLQDAIADTPLDITNAGAGTTTVTPVSKKVPAGDRSVRISKASTLMGTPAFGNPGPPIPVTVTADGTIDIPLPAMDSLTDPTSPHNAYKLWVSLFGGSTAEATANAATGPWYGVRTVSEKELSGGLSGGIFKLEYTDVEATNGDLITFDNEPPSDAMFVGTVAGYPVLVSCQGKPTPTELDGTSPGPSIIPFKPANIVAAPLVLDNGQRNEVPLSPPEIILGSYMAAGRLYLMTANTLQIAVFSSDPDFPVSTRPFWKSGFRNPYALCFVNGRLYGFTSAGPMRSVSDGEEGSEEHSFAADVEEIMKDWKPENVFTQHDPQNECVCYINSGARRNSDGYWESDIVPFMLRNERWSMPITITDTQADRIISGAATVNGHLEFLAGGRDGSMFGAYNSKTFRFDQVSGETVGYYMVWQLSDAGAESRPKKVKRPAVRGKVTANGNVGIHGEYIDDEIDMVAIAAGNSGSKTGAVALSNSVSGVRYRPAEDVGVEGLMVYAIGVAGEWAGVGDRDRIDEVICEVTVQGGRA